MRIRTDTIQGFILVYLDFAKADIDTQNSKNFGNIVIVFNFANYLQNFNHQNETLKKR